MHVPRASRVPRFAVLLLALASPLAAQVPADQAQQAQQAQQELRSDSASQQDIHPTDSPDYRGFLIQSRDRRSTLRIFGSMRVFGVYDLKGLQGARDFSIYDIPVGSGNVREGRYYMEASQTRFGFETRLRHSREVPELFGRFEADFRGSSNTLRLRHAYVQVAGFTVGQTWTTAAHVSTLPNTVDPEGPNSAISLRSVQVRYTQDVRPGVRFAMAAENPSLDASTGSSGGTVSPRIPDFIVRLRGVKGTLRELQAAAIVRSLPYRDSTGRVQDVTGWGMVLSGRFGVRAGRDELLFQGVSGHGISRYLAGFTGRGLDLTLDSATGTVYATLLRGAYVSYGHLVRPGIKAYGTFGYASIVNRAFEPASAFNRGAYGAVSVFRDFPWGARAGAEATWGRRVNKDGGHDNALRLQAALYYDF
jgi:hypothetical protein